MNGTNEERNVGQKVDKKEIGIDFEKEGMGWKKNSRLLVSILLKINL